MDQLFPILSEVEEAFSQRPLAERVTLAVKTLEQSTGLTTKDALERAEQELPYLYKSSLTSANRLANDLLEQGLITEEARDEVLSRATIACLATLVAVENLIDCASDGEGEPCPTCLELRDAVVQKVTDRFCEEGIDASLISSNGGLVIIGKENGGRAARIVQETMDQVFEGHTHE